MAVEARKKRTCNSASSSSGQTRRSCRSKVADNSEKKEERGKKRVLPTEDRNEKTKFAENKTYIPTFIRSIVKNSVIKCIDSTQGFAGAAVKSKFHKEIIINQVKRFQMFKSLNSFDRRVTAMTWHTKYPQIFVAGSKGGDLLLHNLYSGEDYFSPGVGPGGSILGLKCNIDDPYSIYTASLTGKICWGNFQEQKWNVIFSLALSWDNWFTSLDVCKNRKTILTGDCKGHAYLLSTLNEPIWQKKKMHSSKLTHCEFNAQDPNIFVTSSNDHTVKLWDLRTIASSDGKKLQPLAVFPHVKGVNAAYFSPSNGINLLTTDQHSELRIYAAPLWNEEIKITHPHRQFQHMTYMKAIWHPLEDIVIVGRYPDNNIQPDDSRTIDFYDGSNGQLLHQILSPTSNIVSLAAMNVTGEILATAGGYNVALLKDEKLLKGDESEPESDEDSENTTTILNKNKKKRAVTKVAKTVSLKKNILPKKKAL